jgi:hypothetical protein
VIQVDRRVADIGGVPTIEVRLEPEDYVTASRAVAELSWKGIFQLAGVAIVVMLVATFFVVVEDDLQMALVTCGAAFGAGGGVFLAKRITLPRKAHRIFAQTPSLQRPYQVTWDDRALTATSQQGAGMYPWAEFHKSRELAGLFLIFLSDVMFIMVPKRDFPDDATMRNFRECIQTYVRPAQD